MPKLNEIIWFVLLALVSLIVYDLVVKQLLPKTK